MKCDLRDQGKKEQEDFIQMQCDEEDDEFLDVRMISMSYIPDYTKVPFDADLDNVLVDESDYC